MHTQIEFEDQGLRKSEPGQITGIDLFAGAGGFSLGMSMAGLNVVAAVELEKDACWTLHANKKACFPNMRIINEDITTLTGQQLLTMSGIKELDVLFGGPPCQGFTKANINRSVDDPRSKLMFEFIRMVGEIRPKIFTIENVPGLLSFKEFFIYLMGKLERHGYRVRFNMLDAANYGVPQRRRRVFIDGIRSDLNKLPVWPRHTHFGDPYDGKAKPKQFIPPSVMAHALFPVNGFKKSQVHSFKWNQKLCIGMDMRTIERDFDNALTDIIHGAIGIK